MNGLSLIKRAWPLASTSVGGRLRIARSPNQGDLCSRVREHSKKKMGYYFFGCAL
jgi:hypothetical protein